MYHAEEAVKVCQELVRVAETDKEQEIAERHLKSANEVLQSLKQDGTYRNVVEDGADIGESVGYQETTTSFEIALPEPKQQLSSPSSQKRPSPSGSPRTGTMSSPLEHRRLPSIGEHLPSSPSSRLGSPLGDYGHPSSDPPRSQRYSSPTQQYGSSPGHQSMTLGYSQGQGMSQETESGTHPTTAASSFNQSQKPGDSKHQRSTSSAQSQIQRTNRGSSEE
jgi:hypothetical protein